MGAWKAQQGSSQLPSQYLIGHSPAEDLSVSRRATALAFWGRWLLADIESGQPEHDSQAQ